MTAGTAVVRAVEVMLEKGRRLAAHVLEADEKDIAYRRRAFEVVGTDRRVGAVRACGQARAEMKDTGEIAESLDTKRDVDTPQTFPNGCHIAEVEIDPETGEVDAGRLLRGGRLRHRARPHLVMARCMAGSRRGSARRCWRTRSTMPAAGSSSPARSWITPCRARSTCRRSARRAAPGAGDDQSARRQGRGRGRHHRLARRDHECDRRCDPAAAAAHMDMPATMEKVWRACQTRGARVDPAVSERCATPRK